MQLARAKFEYKNNAERANEKENRSQNRFRMLHESIGFAIKRSLVRCLAAKLYIPQVKPLNGLAAAHASIAQMQTMAPKTKRVSESKQWNRNVTFENNATVIDASHREKTIKNINWVETP